MSLPLSSCLFCTASARTRGLLGPSLVIHHSNVAVNLQNRFLEDMVRRLSAELAGPRPSNAGDSAAEDDDGHFHGEEKPLLEWHSTHADRIQ